MAETREHALVLVTCGSEDEGRAIARDLVESRVAAGVQIFPIDSVYRWEGQLVEGSEWLLIAKTRKDRYRAIEEAVLGLHSYDVPPVVMVEVAEASEPYLDWIDALTAMTDS